MDSKDIGIRKSEFVTKTQFLYSDLPGSSGGGSSGGGSSGGGEGGNSGGGSFSNSSSSGKWKGSWSLATNLNFYICNLQTLKFCKNTRNWD